MAVKKLSGFRSLAKAVETHAQIAGRLSYIDEDRIDKVVKFRTLDFPTVPILREADKIFE